MVYKKEQQKEYGYASPTSKLHMHETETQNALVFFRPLAEDQVTETHESLPFWKTIPVCHFGFSNLTAFQASHPGEIPVTNFR